MSTDSKQVDAAEGQLGSLLHDLSSPDAHVRAQARHDLQRMGPPASIHLIKMLSNPSRAIRWEAAMTLSRMGDASATDALIDALDDQRGGIRWLAANGLIAIGYPAVPPLLRALIAHPDDLWLRRGAHHVLTELYAHAHSGPLAAVVKALEGPMPSMEVPVAAYRALDSMEGPLKSHSTPA